MSNRAWLQQYYAEREVLSIAIAEFTQEVLHYLALNRSGSCSAAQPLNSSPFESCCFSTLRLKETSHWCVVQVRGRVPLSVYMEFEKSVRMRPNCDV